MQRWHVAALDKTAQKLSAADNDSDKWFDLLLYLFGKNATKTQFTKIPMILFIEKVNC